MATASTKAHRTHYEASFKKKVILCSGTDGNKATSHAFRVSETCACEGPNICKQVALEGTQ